jgi:hypothetical protein
MFALGAMPMVPVQTGPRSERMSLLQHGFAPGALEDSPAHAGVFAFGVLAHDVAVDVTGLTSGERTPHARHEFDRTHVDVLVEGAAKLQQLHHSETWSGTTSGHPTAPKKIASKPARMCPELHPLAGEVPVGVAHDGICGSDDR